MTKSKSQKPEARSNWFFNHPYQIIFLVCILLHAQILTFGLVHFDDHGFVLMAADNLKLSNIPKFFNHSVFWVLGDTTQDTDVFYRPLQNVLYAICNTISPKNPWSYHFMGLCFHILASCLLFNFFKELKYHSSVALVFALIYSVHPVLVQGTAWIAGIGDQMATVFCLLSAIYFLKSFGANVKAGFILFHLLFFVCALFSKEVSIALIPLCLFWFFVLNKNKANKNLFVSAVGWILIAVVYFIFRSNAIHSAKTSLIASALESFKVNAPLVLEYFEKMFLPYRLSPIPSREDAQFIVGGIVLLSLIALFVFRKRFTKMSLFGALWFVVFLFPLSFSKIRRRIFLRLSTDFIYRSSEF